MTDGPWSHIRETDPHIHTSQAYHCLISRAHRYTLKQNVYIWTTRKEGTILPCEYHPEDPPWELIQHLWHHYVTNPPNEIPLSQLSNNDGISVCLDQLIVAYSCHLNLWNLFCVRNIDNRGKKVLHYLPSLWNWCLSDSRQPFEEASQNHWTKRE